MIDLTQVILAAIALIAALVSAFVVPWLKSNFTATQLQNIVMWVNFAVEAAEMIYKGAGRGEEKKQYVLEFLKSKGFTLNTAEIDALIEAAVLELKLMKKEEASV